MEGKIIDRIFTELDNHTKRLVDLSEVVHANAAILGLVTKLVVAIISFIVITNLGALYNHFKAPPVVLYHKPIAPFERSVDGLNNRDGNPNSNNGGVQ